ncbi:MAG: DUF4231 domain-containing protein [Candidatus Marinimicrobia bacterium]|nr:DUF4231 domain-containing protein [Candidatus Neomarinimicrobiota bacterium]
MNEEEYIKQRLEDQIKWYDEKSIKNKKYYNLFRTLEIIMAGAIPFVVGFISCNIQLIKFVVGLLGVGVAVISGMQSLFKFHENWIEYRTTCESLKHEKYLYLSRCEPYDDESRFCRLVDRVENLISKEHSQWTKNVSKAEKI